MLNSLEKQYYTEEVKEYFPFTHGDFVNVKRQENKEIKRKEFQEMIEKEKLKEELRDSM